MKSRDARMLLASAIPERGGTWADFGAGEGTFTRALAEVLGPESRVYAVDRDAGALATLIRVTPEKAPSIIPMVADFSSAFELPGLGNRALDGLLLANALHFCADGDEVLARLARRLRPGGRVILVEYDRRAASRWVPYPVPIGRLPALAAAAGLSMPTVTATRPSAYGGELYVASAQRSDCH